jgi:hypothetical protein
MFIPLRQTLFFETATRHSEQNQGNRVGEVFEFSNRFLGLRILDRESLGSWSIVMVEKLIVEIKLRSFSTHVNVSLSKFSR